INKHTGTLTLTPPGGGAKHIYFEDGNIRFFSHGTPKTPRIGEILVRSGRLDQNNLDRALEEATASGKLVGKVLLERGHISEEDVQAALKMKVCEELFELFALDDGDFEFNLDSCPEDIFDALQRSVRIEVSTNGVIMEGLRRLDEWQIIRTRVRTENEIFAATEEPVPENCDSPVEEVLSWIDGRRPVSEIVKEYPGSKFDLLKGIFDLVEAGSLVPLDVETLLESAAEAKKERNFAEAATFLRFACETETEDPSLFLELGDVLGKFYQEADAEQAFLAALNLYFDQGDWDKAAAVAERLPPNATLDPKDLQRLLQTFIELKLIRKALWAGQQLATTLQQQGETQKAAEVLDSLVDVDPEDLNLRVQIATLFQQVGETARATEYYEEVAEALELQKKIKDQIKILKMIVELNPKRVELKQKITTLVALQDKLERQRKRRITIAGVAGILLLLLIVIPLVYELKARELHSHANRMEQISNSTGDFTQARHIYEELLRDYSWSSKSHDAELALERIAQVERRWEDTARIVHDTKKKEADDERRAAEEKIDDLLAEAKAAEARRDLEKAHELYKEAQTLGKSSRRMIKFRLPILVESTPEHAQVTINGQVVGTTPVVYNYEPGAVVELKITRKGCDPLDDQITLKDQRELHYDLTRRPINEIVLPSNFEQAPLATGVKNYVVFPSRDGHIYAFDTNSNEMVWKKSVGRFGDRLSDLHVSDGYVYVGTVDNALLAFQVRTGKRRWPTRQIRGPILAAPATSEDSKWAAVANVFGEVYLLDNRTGRDLSRFSTENEIVTSPVFTGDFLLVASKDSYVYGYSVAKKRVVFISELQGNVVIDPIRFESDAIFATNDGRVHRVDTTKHRKAWSVVVTDSSSVATLVSTPEYILAGISNGQVLVMSPKTGLVEKQWKIGKSEPGGMRVRGDILYVCFQSGLVSAWDMKRGEARWTWQADASITSPPLVLNDRLFVACNSGTVQVLDLLD
ncbi:MAG: PQQ-binding-like beta-propeller repeat protein, partial [Planctomycetota bacterium]